MAIYTSVDIQTTDGGDLLLDGVGDFKLADTRRTVAQAINNLLLTDKGELLTDQSFGANLGNYIGERNNDATRSLIQQEIMLSVRQQGLVDIRDFEVDVIPVDIGTAAVICTVNGAWFNTQPSGEFDTTFLADLTDITMAYTYPFIKGTLSVVTV